MASHEHELIPLDELRRTASKLPHASDAHAFLRRRKVYLEATRCVNTCVHNSAFEPIAHAAVRHSHELPIGRQVAGLGRCAVDDPLAVRLVEGVGDLGANAAP